MAEETQNHEGRSPGAESGRLDQGAPTQPLDLRHLLEVPPVPGRAGADRAANGRAHPHGDAAGVGDLGREALIRTELHTHERTEGDDGQGTAVASAEIGQQSAHIPLPEFELVAPEKQALARLVRDHMARHPDSRIPEHPTLVGDPLTDEELAQKREKDRKIASEDTLIHDDLVAQDLAWQRNVQQGFEELGDLREEGRRESPRLRHRLADFAKRIYHLRRDMKAAREAQNDRDGRRAHWSHVPDHTLALVQDSERRAQILKERAFRQNQEQIDEAERAQRWDDLSGIEKRLVKLGSRLGILSDEPRVGSAHLAVDKLMRGEDDILSELRETPQEYRSEYVPREDTNWMQIGVNAPTYLHKGKEYTDYGMPIIGWVFVDGSDDLYVIARRDQGQGAHENNRAFELTRVDRRTGELDSSTSLPLVNPPTPDGRTPANLVQFRTRHGKPVEMLATLNDNQLRLATMGKSEIHLLANPQVGEEAPLPQAA